MNTSVLAFFQLIPDNGLSTAPAGYTHATPTDYRVLWPTMIIFTTPSTQVLVELDAVYYLCAHGGVFSEDRTIDDNGQVYRIFQNCNRTDIWAYLAIKEE
jgi:hypothetical protein